MIKFSSVACTLMAVAALFVSPVAHAQNAVLQLMNNASTVTIGDGSINDSNPNVGVITYVGAVGDFQTNVTTGTSKPVAGSATSPQLALNSLNITNTTNMAETLTILFSDNNFGPVTGVPQASVAISQLGQSPSGPPNGSVTYKGYWDSGNTTLAQTTLLTSIGPVTVSGTNVGALGTFASPFSLTQALQITLNAGGTFQGSAVLTITPVPEINGVVSCVLAALVIGVGFARRQLIKAKLQRSAPSAA